MTDALRRDRMEAFAVVGVEDSKLRLAEAYRLLQDRCKDRREIARRRVDHLQHLGGRGLLLQRLALLVDQPRVLHRDHRLRREVLQQGNLLVGEAADFLAIERDEADRQAASLRAAHGGACGRLPDRPWRGTPGMSAQVPHRLVASDGLDRLPRQQCPRISAVPAIGAVRALREIFGERRGNAAACQPIEYARHQTSAAPERRTAQPHRLLQHRIEHRRQIAGRGVDDLQHLGRRGLLLQRLALSR